MTSSSALTVVEALDGVKACIRKAENGAGRQYGSVQLVAVSKNHVAEKLQLAIDAGQRCFGENRVQEAVAKWSNIRCCYPDLELHLIGQLQKNKVREAVKLFDVIETLDRESVAKCLASEMASQQKWPRLFIQVNTGEEPQKAGISPEEAPAFIDLCLKNLALPVVGLMCIPPLNDNPSPHFALLADIAARHGLHDLSMGMSSDYELAISFGSTFVRVGSAIFGAR